ncbi:MAG: hypothetical protein JSV90_09305 [Methanobacteriota archaeon]|nr:MAG: hypothetical protein JSV90_09305 [Euryarchaeota archaeon]
MLNRKTAQAAARNARAIDWVRTHTVQDLSDLADEMRAHGEDVQDIVDLLDEIREIETGLCSEEETVQLAAG